MNRAAASRTRRGGGGGGGGPPVRAVLGRGDLFGSLLYVFPLFVIYGVGVLFTPAMNGVDFVTRYLYAAVGYSTRNYLLVHAGMAVLFAGVLVWMRRQGVLRHQPFLAMLLESAVVALALGSLIVFVMRHVFQLDVTIAAAQPSLAPLAAGGGEGGTGAGGPDGIAARVILSLGAGVHEELVFRLGLFAGSAAVLRVCGVRHAWAVWVAALASAALFSAAHHIGPMGDPWQLNTFVYRWLAGLVFTALFYWRSLAHAVYTHAFYDLYVFLILR
jgi:hypothetical protein